MGQGADNNAQEADRFASGLEETNVPFRDAEALVRRALEFTMNSLRFRVVTVVFPHLARSIIFHESGLIL